MGDNNWDRNRWQGRRKGQVESTNIILYVTITAITFMIALDVLNYIINRIELYCK